MPIIPLSHNNALRHIRYHVVTVCLIGVCCGVFFLQERSGYAWTASLGVVPGELVGGLPAQGLPEVLTLLTYQFLHGDVWHIAFNMWFLWMFGENVEDALGHTRFLIFYLVVGVLAGLVQVVASPGSGSVMVGASGAISGVVAAYALLYPKSKIWILLFKFIPLKLPAILVIGGWIAYQIWNAVTAVGPGVAWYAHVGGIVAGLILIKPMLPRRLPVSTGPVLAAERPRRPRSGPWG